MVMLCRMCGKMADSPMTVSCLRRLKRVALKTPTDRKGCAIWIYTFAPLMKLAYTVITRPSHESVFVV